LESANCSAPHRITLEQARAFLLARARRVEEIEVVPTHQALGRVLAHAVTAPLNVPGYDNSAMDGYALCSADVAGQGVTWLPVSQRVVAGQPPEALRRGTVARIFTGAPLPSGADAVVMQEQCRVTEEHVGVPAPVPQGLNVRLRGNDIAAGAQVLAAGTRLRPQELGLAASLGLEELPVYRVLRVAIFSTGSELVNPGVPLQHGQIYNSNRYTLHGLLAGPGYELHDLGTVRDDLDATCAALEEGARVADLVLSSGGVSVGEEDHVKRALEQIGRLELWRIAVKPGKPVAYGRVQAADFLGLPGNPVSVLVAFCLLVRPFLLRRQGATDVSPVRLPVRADFTWLRSGDRLEFVRARFSCDELGRPQATVFGNQGSDVLSSTVWADGLVEIPAGTTVARGDTVNYLSFSNLLA
jgi:molybdopterin molybdotransferase